MPSRIPCARHHERTAQDFVDLLSPAKGLLAGHNEPGEFVFRGHGSHRYRLVPSVFRGRGLPFPDRRRGWRRTHENQVFAEVELLWQFFVLADARGLRLPEDSQSLRKILEDCREEDFRDRLAAGAAVWPPDEVLSVLALAQHYGVPTRLLDWTRHPYVAAYFAALDALQGRHDGRLAVIAFETWPVFSGEYPWLQERFQLVTAPAADIPNLYAQQGLFLLLKDREIRRSAPFRARPYDETIMKQIEFNVTRPVFYKFTLPTSQASELLRLVRALGIDGSLLFPGYDGVARALREQMLLPPPGTWHHSRSARTARSRYAEIWDRWRGT